MSTNSLREAAQQALEAMDCPGKAKTADEQAAITALKAALAEPVQEPVLFWHKRDQEDEQFISPEAMNGHCPDCEPLYTAPPQRKPLTEEEIKECERQAMVNGALPFEQRVFFARAIERAHGITE